jgi:hypothetical protein
MISVIKKPNNFLIVGHKGSFGNHVRLLLCLSNEFEWNNCATTNSKFQWIADTVYSNITWHNWLYQQRLKNRELEKLIPFAHNMKSKSQFTRVVLISDPELSYRSYIKFSSTLDIGTKELFVETCTVYNDTVREMARARDIVIDSGMLFRSNLDQSWYDNLVIRLNLSNEYVYANQLHQRWYQLHRQAEKDMIRDLSLIFSDK